MFFPQTLCGSPSNLNSDKLPNTHTIILVDFILCTSQLFFCLLHFSSLGGVHFPQILLFRIDFGSIRPFNLQVVFILRKKQEASQQNKIYKIFIAQPQKQQFQ